MFDKLLLPIDPSKRLRPARNYALALAKRLEVPLIATYISNPSKTGTITASSETNKGFDKSPNFFFEILSIILISLLICFKSFFGIFLLF